MTDPTPPPTAPGGQPDPAPPGPAGPEGAAGHPAPAPPGPAAPEAAAQSPEPAPPTSAGLEGAAHDPEPAPPAPARQADVAQPPEPGGPGPEPPGPADTAQLPEADERDPGAGSGAEPSGRGPAAGSGAEGFEGDPTAWPPDEAFDATDLDDRGWTRRDLEAILLVADEPVPATVLAEVVGSRLSEVEELLVDLAGEYARDGRGFVLRMIAGGWRLYTHPGTRTAVEAFLRAGQQSRLTRAALETLAVIAYRQPVTRFQVAAVRGVNVDGVFRTLASRGLIQEVGTDPGPGQATLYGTTPAFLEQLGLNDLDQLPPIKDYLPEGVDLLDLQEQL
ncbi:MAG: SMC-Scp complex subunit ScpB [Actinomycetes bacterium]